MPRELTFVLLRSHGRAPVTLHLCAWSMLTLALVATAITASCVWAGWQLGELTFAI